MILNSVVSTFHLFFFLIMIKIGHQDRLFLCLFICHSALAYKTTQAKYLLKRYFLNMKQLKISLESPIGSAVGC